MSTDEAMAKLFEERDQLKNDLRYASSAKAQAELTLATIKALLHGNTNPTCMNIVQIIAIYERGDYVRRMRHAEGRTMDVTEVQPGE